MFFRSLKLSWRLLFREWRAGEFRILFAAATLAVAVVTGLSALMDRFQGALMAESDTFLAADRAVQSTRALPPEWQAAADQIGLITVKISVFSSMAFGPEGGRLASVKAVEPGYPLKGQLQISDLPFGEARPVSQGPPSGEAWLDSRLFSLLGLAPGDVVTLGNLELRVSKALINEPDRGANFLGFAPRIMIHRDMLDGSGLIQPGSRFQHRLLVRGSDEQLNQFESTIEPLLTDHDKLLNARDDSPAIAETLDRSASFLILAGTLGIILAGVAVSTAARQFSLRQHDPVAILKTIGFTPNQVVVLYLAQLALLALAATVAGVGLGFLIQVGLAAVLSGLLAVALPGSGPWSAVLGLVTSVVCLFGFAAQPFLALRQVSPMRIIQNTGDAALASSAWTILLGFLLLFLLSWLYTRDLLLSAVLFGGVATLALLVFGLAAAMLLGFRRLSGLLNPSGRLGMSMLYRRLSDSAVNIMIFGVAIMMLLIITILRTTLIDQWQDRIPADAPNYFLVNIPAGDVEKVRRQLREGNVAVDPFYPIVRGRLIEKNGDSITGTLDEEARDFNAIKRELALTWQNSMPDHNLLEKGQWWPPDNAPASSEASLELELAETLGLDLGDELTFSVGGQTFTSSVTSIRSVNWDSMKPNFYIILSPGTLDRFSGMYLTSFHVKAGNTDVLDRLLKDNVELVLFDIESTLNRVRAIVNQVSRIIELVLAIIMVVGLVVLIASINTTIAQRTRETAILRTLGASRSLVLSRLCIEFSILGLLAGTVAVFGAEVVVYVMQQTIFKLPYEPTYWLWPLSVILSTALIVGVGLWRTRTTLNVPPIVSLRSTDAR